MWNSTHPLIRSFGLADRPGRVVREGLLACGIDVVRSMSSINTEVQQGPIGFYYSHPLTGIRHLQGGYHERV